MIVAAASAAGSVLTTGLAVTAWLARNEAIHQRQVAEQRTLTAERTLDFVKSMFRVSDPSEARGASITAREVVDRGARMLDHGLDQEPAAKAYLEEYGISYPNGPDLRSEAARRYGIKGVPETFFINPAGDITQIIIGPVLSQAQMDQYLAEIRPK